MAQRFRQTYQGEGALEQAVVDLVRVGSGGFASGVRQLATRLVRAVPPGVADPEKFQAAVREAIAESTRTPELRFAGGDLPSDDTDAAHPLVDVDPMPSGDGLITAANVMQDLHEIVEERRRSDELARAGVDLTKTVMLSGPPGVGKTMTARWLAEQIGLPLVTLDLSSAISSYLGSSGRNIRSILDYAKSGPCVLLLDEFDALAKRRDDETDIGELKRIVNVVLTELDRWPDTSLLVAATNHPQLLDPAVGRRFDRALELDLPEMSERVAILHHLADGSELQDDRIVPMIAELTAGLSGSDLARMWQLARRKSVLHGQTVDAALLAEVAWRSYSSGPARDKLWLLMSERLGLSNRQIAARAHVSHPTVSSAIKRARAPS